MKKRGIGKQEAEEIAISSGEIGQMSTQEIESLLGRTRQLLSALRAFEVLFVEALDLRKKGVRIC